LSFLCRGSADNSSSSSSTGNSSSSSMGGQVTCLEPLIMLLAVLTEIQGTYIP
jgi:hypothetical protein